MSKTICQLSLCQLHSEDLRRLQSSLAAQWSRSSSVHLKRDVHHRSLCSSCKTFHKVGLHMQSHHLWTNGLRNHLASCSRCTQRTCGQASSSCCRLSTMASKELRSFQWKTGSCMLQAPSWCSLSFQFGQWLWSSSIQSSCSSADLLV